ncbi:MAG: hypothetical protein H7A31_00560 [Thermotogae bacterium]|nr:hypothetical protein [Thermotogota bacterium]
MKKFLLIILSSVLALSIFAGTFTFGGQSFNNNKAASVNATVKVQVQQWIAASAEGRNITFSKPGVTDFIAIADFSWISNANVNLQISSTNTNTGFSIVGLQFGDVDSQNSSLSVNNVSFPFSYNSVDNTFTVEPEVLEAKFDVDPSLAAQKDNPYTFGLTFTFAPTVTF